MVFGQKCPVLELLFFTVKQARKISLTKFQKEETPFQPLKTRRSKSRKIDSFPKGLTYGFGSKMDNFSTSFFLGNIGQEHVFYDILERKHAILGYQKRNSKTRKIAIILKELNPWFLYKNSHFSNFFLLGNVGQEKELFSIFQN